MSIGARSQSAKTYLERHYDEFPDCMRCLNLPSVMVEAKRRWAGLHFTGDVDALIQHGLKALRETLQQDKDLTTLNTSIVNFLFSFPLLTLQALFLMLEHLSMKGLVGPAIPHTTLQQPTFDAGSAPTGEPRTVTSVRLPKKQTNFVIIEGDELKPYLDKLEPKPEAGAAAAATEGTGGSGAAATGGVSAMDTD
jgi:20S proteasome subunit alpha 6